MKYDGQILQLALGLQNPTFVKLANLSILHELDFILPFKLQTSHFKLSQAISMERRTSHG